MMGMARCLRSQSVAATRQEIWGILIAYNLVRLEMARTAEQAKCAPNDVSFIFALGVFQLEMLHAASERALALRALRRLTISAMVQAGPSMCPGTTVRSNSAASTPALSASSRRVVPL